MRALPLLALALVATVAADDALAVSSEPAADGKTLVSARAGGWGAAPLGPGTVTFSTAGGGASASGDVHLGLAQAVLTLPCGAPTRVAAVFVPAGPGARAAGETTVPASC